MRRLRDTRRRHGITLDDRFVGLRRARGRRQIDGEDLLEDVRAPEGFESPDFPSPRALTTVLSLTTEWLLRDERVRTDGASVHLVIDHVTELQEVGHTDRSGLVELLTRTTVEEVGLTIAGKPSLSVQACISSSEAPSKIGVANLQSRRRPAQARTASKI